jgi:1,4-alpha-glucan branching enzyme
VVDVAPVAAPSPAAPTAVEESSPSDRMVARQFVIESERARQVALVGDFNQWNPERHRLHRDGRTARWFITVQLPAGLHKYAFIVDDSVWTPDPSAVRTVDRDFGVTSSLVLVQ